MDASIMEWLGSVAERGFFSRPLQERPARFARPTVASKASGPRRGRAVDHIGFEVEGLEAFVQEMEPAGVVFDVPYREIASLGFAIAFYTDPAGVYVELTEGLADYR